MPIPKKEKNEDKKDFVQRCMKDKIMTNEYETEQKVAICIRQSVASKQPVSIVEHLQNEIYGSEEDIQDVDTMFIPEDTDYVDFEDEDEETIDLSLAKYAYRDQATNEIFYFERKSSYKKNGRHLVFVSEAAEKNNKKVKLNKPFRTPDGPKKMSVYVKNEKGNVVKVNFGDPNMKIKKNIPERRKSFRARHNCDNPGPKWKARYWSCKAW